MRPCNVCYIEVFCVISPRASGVLLRGKSKRLRASGRIGDGYEREMCENILTTVTGTRDLLPDEMAGWHVIEDKARSIFSLYGFQEIRTPVFEATELFARGIGGDTDIVGKEMYTFLDQGGKSLSLRPEATASVVRAFIQHSMHRDAGLTRLYYIGPMFRHEKKQKGRWRQFYQIGAEALGSESVAVEFEILEMLLHFLARLEVQSQLMLNSVGCPACRPPFVKKLQEELRSAGNSLCEDCRRRTDLNPLRVLDCKIPECQATIERMPSITDHLCAECAAHFRRLLGYLDHAAISYSVVPRLVRGLDYYVRTAFEIVSGGLGAQNALVGGGRYDGLSEVLGGPRAPGFGFALGVDRLAMILPDHVGREAAYSPDLFLAYIGDAALSKALGIARALRSAGWKCHMEYTGGSLKSQMRLANRLNARHVLIIGDAELERKRYLLKRMADSRQWELEDGEIAAVLSAGANP